MRLNRDLRAPWLPQMNNNGIIDADDLDQGSVYVMVPAYSNMALGDQIVIYFDTLVTMAKIVDPGIINQNCLFAVPQAQIPDGVYSVYYTAMDVVGNASTSSKTTAIVSRDGTRTLIPPVFTDAVNNVLSLDSVLANEGTHIQVPAYNGIRAGDIVELNYLLFNANNEVIPEANFSASHTVVNADISSGYITLIPESKIFLPESARAMAFYRVTRASNGSVALSFDAEVMLDGDVSFLEKPHFTDAVDGWLTQHEVTGGIRVHINGYSGMAAGDVLTLLWQGFDTDNASVPAASGSMDHTVTVADVQTGVIYLTLSRDIAQAIYMGRLDAWYRVRTPSGARKVSYTGSSFINLASIVFLPAPSFPQADDSTIETDVIEADGVLNISILYDSMVMGDEIALTLSGKDKTGADVAAASYQQTFTVSRIEAQIVAVPGRVAIAVGDSGFLYAGYSVKTLAGTSVSLTESVMIVESGAKPKELAFRSTHGAPVYDYGAIHVSPCNYGFIRASAGTRLMVSCPKGAVILESGSTSYSTVMGVSGVKSIRVQSTSVGGVTVFVQNLDNPSESVTGTMTFSNYRLGEGKILAIANTSGALPDGVSPCSIYLMMAEQSDDQPTADDLSRQPITSLRVSVPLPLKVAGHGPGESVELMLNADHSAQVNIVSDVAVDSAAVIITSPQSSGTYQTVNMSFTDFK